MPAKGAGMGKAGGATAMGGGGACGYVAGDSVGKALTYSKHNGHASKGRHPRGSPRNLRVQN